MIWSPYLINLVLHYYSSPVRFERCHAPLYEPAIQSLIKLEVLEDAGLDQFGDQYYRTTEKGVALVEMWCSTPLPEKRFIDPRFEEKR